MPGSPLHYDPAVDYASEIGKRFPRVPPSVRETILRVSREEDVSPFFMMTMANIESGFRADALSPSKARGWYQFMSGTATQYGIRGAESDLYLSAQAAARLAKDNAVYLSKHGIPLTDVSLYMAHQEGAGGATSIYRNALGLSKGFTATERRNLAANHSAGLTGSQIVDKWSHLYAKKSHGLNGLQAEPVTGITVARGQSTPNYAAPPATPSHFREMLLPGGTKIRLPHALDMTGTRYAPKHVPETPALQLGLPTVMAGSDIFSAETKRLTQQLENLWEMSANG